jgi:hypothetical protein
MAITDNIGGRVSGAAAAAAAAAAAGDADVLMLVL